MAFTYSEIVEEISKSRISYPEGLAGDKREISRLMRRGGQGAGVGAALTALGLGAGAVHMRDIRNRRKNAMPRSDETPGEKWARQRRTGYDAWAGTTGALGTASAAAGGVSGHMARKRAHEATGLAGTRGATWGTGFNPLYNARNHQYQGRSARISGATAILSAAGLLGAERLTREDDQAAWEMYDRERYKARQHQLKQHKR